LKKAVAWNGLENFPRRHLATGLGQAEGIKEARAILRDHSHLGLPFEFVEKEGLLAIIRV